MREVLDYCTGGTQRSIPAGTIFIHEGGTTGHLFVLIEGRLEVVKGDTVVANIIEPGAVVGEMSVLLDKPHTATVRAAADSTVYEFGNAASFLNEQPAVARKKSQWCRAARASCERSSASFAHTNGRKMHS